MAEVEFFWDPVCPWAWLTSRWIRNVQAVRALDVAWRPISLAFVNEGKDYATEFPAGYQEIHARGLRLLRVAAALDATGHGDRVADLYTGYGEAMHVRQEHRAFDDPSRLRHLLAELGLPESYADATWSTDHDDAIRASTSEALARTGGNVGTPIISWSPPDGPSFFGPVISKAPAGDEAVRLWDAITELGSNPWFSELKRSTRSAPQFT